MSINGTLYIHRMGGKSADVWEYCERIGSGPLSKAKKTTSFKKIAHVIEDASGRGLKISFRGKGITE